MSLGPAPVLALLLGILHVSIYVLIRGSAGQRLPWMILAAFLGGPNVHPMAAVQPLNR